MAKLPTSGKVPGRPNIDVSSVPRSALRAYMKRYTRDQDEFRLLCAAALNPLVVDIGQAALAAPALSDKVRAAEFLADRAHGTPHAARHPLGPEALRVDTRNESVVRFEGGLPED